MNIDEIRAEIPKSLEGDAYKLMGWYNEHKKPYAAEICGCSEKGQREDNVRILVDMAYEAGVKRGGEISISALNEVELRENPLYQKGYEAGITESGKKLYEKGYEEAAKDPEAWYVLDNNGEQIHRDDKVRVRGFSSERTVFALGDEAVIFWLDGSRLNSARSDLCEKVIPDTRDKIKYELTEALYENAAPDIDAEEAAYIAEQFISRIEALGE